MHYRIIIPPLLNTPPSLINPTPTPTPTPTQPQPYASTPPPRLLRHPADRVVDVDVIRRRLAPGQLRVHVVAAELGPGGGVGRVVVQRAVERREEAAVVRWVDSCVCVCVRVCAIGGARGWGLVRGGVTRVGFGVCGEG